LGADLRRGEIGCFLSHIDALERFLATGSELTLVLEDDANFSEVNLTTLNEIVDELLVMPQSSWACLNLTEVYVKWRDLLKDAGQWKLYRAYYFPMLASGLIWNRVGARSFLGFVRSRGVFLPVDQQVRFFLACNGLGLSLDKPLIPLFEFPTTISERELSPRPAWFAKPNRRLHNYWHSFLCRLKVRLGA
jgi:glycosyl transferase, family 25